MSGLYDLGPLGCSVQNNLVDEWKRHFILHDKMLQIDCAILTPEAVLKASGHTSKFADIMVRDAKTNEPYRVDHLLKSELDKLIRNKAAGDKKIDELNAVVKRVENSEISSMSDIDSLITKYGIKSPSTGNSLTNAAPFNLMFQSRIGSNIDSKWFSDKRFL
jgi:glycyl-tRNA synthetase